MFCCCLQKFDASRQNNLSDAVAFAKNTLVTIEGIEKVFNAMKQWQYGLGVEQVESYLKHSSAIDRTREELQILSLMDCSIAADSSSSSMKFLKMESDDQ